jgi:two-component system, OmpR family, phosphate regulon response regulator PhoB
MPTTDGCVRELDDADMPASGSSSESPTEADGRQVLVVDDDDVIRRLVRSGLEREGFVVRDAPDGDAALEDLQRSPASLVILDVNLGTVGGFDVLSKIRASSDVPVILLTGRVSETDRVLGLELGADDYVVKPFSPRELASRVRAVLRRTTRTATHALDFGSLRVDLDARRVFLGGDLVELTAREFDLLTFLASSPGQVFSRSLLLEQVWHSTEEWQDPATVTEHVRRLRAKLEAESEQPRWIRTVRAKGYAFEP